MLKPYSKSSFYLDGELIDTNKIEYEVSKRSGNHKKLQAVCKLRLVAQALEQGYKDATEETIRKWIQEAK